ncbi:aspartate/glutamate racemase family protein [Chloroflexota bacterium]
MTYAYLPGPQQSNVDIQMIKGQAIAGCAIGILVLDLWYPYVPGNVANGSTFDFPVLFKILRGTKKEPNKEHKILSADPALLDSILEAGEELERQGVRAIVGACGYFANYQSEAAKRINVPTFLSSILQIPIILRGLKPKQKVGIICGDGPSLTPNLLGQCGVEDLSRVAIIGAEKGLEFQKLINSIGHFNSYKIEQELIALAKELVSKNPEVGAILLECSDMPPYAWAIQNAVKLPVFDFISLINWVYYGVVRRPFAGFI